MSFRNEFGMTSQFINLASMSDSIVLENKSLFGLNNFKIRAIIVALIGLVFYFNTLQNEYALDDGIVIVDNDFVQEGLSGIGKIMSNDAFSNYYEKMNAKDQLSGGRYRPLSIVTFAIEQEFFGNNATVRHLFNVLFYVLSLLVLLYFLHYFLLNDQPDIAFLTTLLFAIHPIHTEVIANVKSRDEILSFLFIISTLIGVVRYHREKKIWILLLTLIMYFCALLSKEYAITLLVFIPLLLYLKENFSIQKSIIAVLPFLVIVAGYLYLRFSIVVFNTGFKQTDILNDPFILASAEERKATQIGILLNYLKLLFWPHPLSADYAYNTIPYINFSAPKVWLSIIIHLGMIAFAIKLFLKKHVLSFAIFFYLAHLAMVSNLVIDLGATMGERLLYHSSFGFAMVMGWLIIKGVQKTGKSASVILYVLLIPIVLLSGFKTIDRNKDWESDTTLFIEDVKTVPNSVMVNGNAGAQFINLATEAQKKGNVEKEKALVNKAIAHLTKAVTLHPKYTNGYVNLCVAYLRLRDCANAEKYLAAARKIYPTHPQVRGNVPFIASCYLNKGLAQGEKGEVEPAIQNIEKSLTLDSLNAEAWYHLGGASFTVKNYQRAKEAWTKCLQLKPDHADAKRGLTALGAL